MIRWLRSVITVSVLALIAVAPVSPAQTDPQERHLLYVAVPGVRNYVEHGGVGILVFDVAHGHRFVRRIPTFDTRDGEAPAAIKGIAASAQHGKVLYMPSLEGPHWHAIDAATGEVIATVITNSGAHNTIYGLDGSAVYLAGLASPTLNV